MVFGEDPDVFAAAALTGVYHEAAAAEGHPAEGPGDDASLEAGEDKGAQVHVAGFEAAIDEAGGAGEGLDGLGDEVCGGLA